VTVAVEPTSQQVTDMSTLLAADTISCEGLAGAKVG